MLCGISTSFPVLSPNRRQVAHALLTRPPLFHPRRDFTVRLECVMHAASVHPEPGSNSLKNGIYCLSAVHSFLELAYLSFLLLFRVSKFVRDSFTRTFVFLPSWCSKFLLFNFQRPIASRRLAVSFISIHQSFRFVMRISKLFSLFFASCFFLLNPLFN